MNGSGSAGTFLRQDEIASILGKAITDWKPDGKRVLVVIPDNTRTCPLDQVFPILYAHLERRVKALDFLVALGTHPPMTPDQILSRVGITKREHETKYAKARFFNHAWKDQAALTKIGSLTAKDVAKTTDGLFEMDVTITCNRMVMDHDLVLIVGPVFPHEVVGFSGGNKYLFPGIAGKEIIDFFHWLGAVITNPEIIGRKHTAVRAVVDRAAALLQVERRAACMVVNDGKLTGLFCGTPEEAWSAAADLSAAIHIKHTDRLFNTVLSCAPAMYEDLWTGGKCMYKVEPVVADGGKVIIYAPHIKEISPVHGRVLHEIGYHTRDFFLKHWDKYKHYPWGVLAHSTHVKGTGTFENGVEKPRIEVILATGIPEETCRKVNLGYMDYKSVNTADFTGREKQGILCVPKAGEILYKSRGF
jgi:lactate racemase